MLIRDWGCVTDNGYVLFAVNIYIKEFIKRPMITIDECIDRCLRKYLNENTKYSIPKFLYHATPSCYLSSIKKNGLDLFDKYIYRAIDKAEVCKEENIDVMIDDSTDNCKKVSSIGVKTMYFKGAESFELPESKCLKTVYNWGEVYRELGKSEIK